MVFFCCSLKVKFIKEGKTYEGYGKPGDTLLDVIINNELDFDGYGGDFFVLSLPFPVQFSTNVYILRSDLHSAHSFTGACEGTLACSTCHVILSKADYDRLPNKPCDEELDMLDLAYDLTKTYVQNTDRENG